jgi:hypothetical protein
MKSLRRFLAGTQNDLVIAGLAKPAVAIPESQFSIPITLSPFPIFHSAFHPLPTTAIAISMSVELN